MAAASNDSSRGLLTPASAHYALAPCPPPLATRTTNQQERRRPEAPACRPPEVTRQRPLRLLWPLPATSPHLLPPPPTVFLLISSNLLSYPPSLSDLLLPLSCLKL